MDYWRDKVLNCYLVILMLLEADDNREVFRHFTKQIKKLKVPYYFYVLSSSFDLFKSPPPASVTNKKVWINYNKQYREIFFILYSLYIIIFSFEDFKFFRFSRQIIRSESKPQRNSRLKNNV